MKLRRIGLCHQRLRQLERRLLLIASRITVGEQISGLQIPARFISEFKISNCRAIVLLPGIELPSSGTRFRIFAVQLECAAVAGNSTLDLSLFLLRQT